MANYKIDPHDVVADITVELDGIAEMQGFLDTALVEDEVPPTALQTWLRMSAKSMKTLSNLADSLNSALPRAANDAAHLTTTIVNRGRIDHDGRVWYSKHLAHHHMQTVLVRVNTTPGDARLLVYSRDNPKEMIAEARLLPDD